MQNIVASWVAFWKRWNFWNRILSTIAFLDFQNFFFIIPLVILNFRKLPWLMSYSALLCSLCYQTKSTKSFSPTFSTIHRDLFQFNHWNWKESPHKVPLKISQLGGSLLGQKGDHLRYQSKCKQGQWWKTP